MTLFRFTQRIQMTNDSDLPRAQLRTAGGNAIGAVWAATQRHPGPG